MSGALPVNFNIRATLETSSWFAGLPQELRDWLTVNARVLGLSAGERLLARGDAPDGLYCVGSGRLRLSGVSEAGQEAVLAVLNPPHWFGEIALFDGQARTHDVWSETDVILIHIPQPQLKALLTETPEYWRLFGLLLAQKMRSTFTLVEDLLLLDPIPRVARRLTEIAFGYHPSQVNSLRKVQVTQDQLASMLALSRQTINGALRHLEAGGSIRRRRGAIEITDLAGLKKAGCPLG